MLWLNILKQKIQAQKNGLNNNESLIVFISILQTSIKNWEELIATENSNRPYSGY